MTNYLLTIDQGTTGTKVMLVDEQRNMIGSSYQKHTQYYPRSGWVEHDPLEIWGMVKAGVQDVLQSTGINPSSIRAIGMANQGETVLAWDSATKIPIYHAIVWSCRRSESIAEKWAKDGNWNQKVKQKTGLLIDSYFSATKVRWMMDHVPEFRDMVISQSSTLKIGTLDAWLISNMTGNEETVTDYSTAARTLLFNIYEKKWDQEILEYIGISENSLPVVQETVSEFGTSDPALFCGIQAPILVSIVDQPAALYGHLCVEEGSSKCTYGTGCFAYMNIGEENEQSQDHSLLKTIVWSKGGKTTYAIDGAVFSAGSVLEWAMDSFELFHSMEELQQLSMKWLDEEYSIHHDLFFVPALSGTGAPYWNGDTRGMFVGITHATGKEHMVRTILEGIAHRVVDVFEEMQKSSGISLPSLRVDGGLSVNPFLMQIQADLLGVPVEVPEISETTSMGLALMLGEACGYWKMDVVKKSDKLSKIYHPSISNEKREFIRGKWKKLFSMMHDYYA